MILDSLLLLAEDVTNTMSLASTSTIDTVAAGDSYEGAWFVVQVSTSFTAGLGAPTTIFQLQTSATEAFGTSVDVTLIATGATLVAGLPAGTFFKVRIPPGALRYIRAFKLVSNYASTTIALGACGYSMFITKDVTIPVEAPNVLA